MSSFLCPYCHNPIIDSGHNYTSDCEHYPLEKPMITRIGGMIDRQSGHDPGSSKLIKGDVTDL